MDDSPVGQGFSSTEEPSPADVVAVVLTHRRPRLARETVLGLIHDERFPPDRIVLVIDREGGLDDPDLEGQLRTIRLTENLGPAAGFRAGIAEAFARPEVRWAYLCEDDACLLGVPAPRLTGLLGALGSNTAAAVVVAGRRFIGRGDKTIDVVPDASGPRLQPVDVAAWGMALIPRAVYEAGVLPDDLWFFGYEDFDFFLRARAASIGLYLDRDAALAVESTASRAGGWDAVYAGRRPTTAQEPWRAYYVARNTFELIRRHGRPTWYGWHLLYSLRRWQLGDRPTRKAINRGFRDGLRRQGGRNPAFVRTQSERSPSVHRSDTGVSSAMHDGDAPAP